MYNELIPDLTYRISDLCINNNIKFDRDDLQSIICIIIGMSMISGKIECNMVERATRKYFTLLIESSNKST